MFILSEIHPRMFYLIQIISNYLSAILIVSCTIHNYDDDTCRFFVHVFASIICIEEKGASERFHLIRML